MDAQRVISKNGHGPAEYEETAHVLEDYYAGPMPLTLGKLRTSLEAISALYADNTPSLAEFARVMREVGLAHLSVASVDALITACSDIKTRDIAGSFTLKQLEELLGRIERV